MKNTNYALFIHLMQFLQTLILAFGFYDYYKSEWFLNPIFPFLYFLIYHILSIIASFKTKNWKIMIDTTLLKEHHRDIEMKANDECNSLD